MIRFAISLSMLFVVHNILAAEQFFREGSLSSDRQDHEFREKTCIGALRAFDEPSFMTLVEKGIAEKKEMYRFTWLRTIDRPICITLESAEHYTVTYKILDGKGGYKLGKLATTKSVEIGRADFDRFIALMDDADYWQMIPDSLNHAGKWFWSEDEHKWGRWNSSTHDGAEWVLEYCGGNQYYVAWRSNPAKSAFGKACLFLVKLAGLENEEVY